MSAQPVEHDTTPAPRRRSNPPRHYARTLAIVVRQPEDDTEAEPTPTDPLWWRDYALCAQTDPEAFFPEKGGSTREAKRVCLSCEVRVECLDYAIANGERFGIWGGLSEQERRRVLRRAV